MEVSNSVWRNLLLKHLLDACKYWFLFFWDDLRFSFSRMFTSIFFFFFRVWEVSTCLKRYYISSQSYIRNLSLVGEVNFRMIQKTNINYILFYEKYSQRMGSWVSREVGMLFCVNEYLFIYNLWIVIFPVFYFLYFKYLPILCWLLKNWVSFLLSYVKMKYVKHFVC